MVQTSSQNSHLTIDVSSMMLDAKKIKIQNVENLQMIMLKKQNGDHKLKLNPETKSEVRITEMQSVIQNHFQNDMTKYFDE